MYLKLVLTCMFLCLGYQALTNAELTVEEMKAAVCDEHNKERGDKIENCMHEKDREELREAAKDCFDIPKDEVRKWVCEAELEEIKKIVECSASKLEKSEHKEELQKLMADYYDCFNLE